MRLSVAVGLAALTTTLTARAAPKSCAANISIDPKPGHFDGTATGKVTSIKPSQYWTNVHLDPDFAFTIAMPDKLPFAVGDTISIAYHCGGGHQIVCDTRLTDSHNTTLLISAALGSDTLSDGFTSKPGAVLHERQDPNAKDKSIERTLALVLTHGTASGVARNDACTEIKDGKTTWLAAGFAIRWEGLRPPEGIDYQQYSLIPVRK